MLSKKDIDKASDPIHKKLLATAETMYSSGNIVDEEDEEDDK